MASTVRLYLLHSSKTSAVYYSLVKGNGKGKAVPLQALRGPEGSKTLKFPDLITTAQDGGKVVSLTHRPLLPPGNAPGTHLCYGLSRSQSHSHRVRGYRLSEVT